MRTKLAFHPAVAGGFQLLAEFLFRDLAVAVGVHLGVRLIERAQQADDRRAAVGSLLFGGLLRGYLGLLVVRRPRQADSGRAEEN